ncbi:probable 28S ribosomal protein S26, mitochondrial [Agrilus planipennis]|uniref:Small ribosomal subunit protein mS26 n=1 Tax=Agrilus planipennis TaxID=224129 RepID=A0A1W4XTN2_AGRPL|nr:probable 28S ribosomal protein S26, mitochondrial [Agrilus planipennis]
MNVITNSSKSVITTAIHIPFPQTFQSVRWARKPRWLGTAKSKLFRIPPRPVIPKEEELELRRLNNNYRTQMKSIRNYLTERYHVKYLPSSNVEQIREDFEKDFAQCNEINTKWNEEIKVLREQRIAEEINKNIEEAKKQLNEQIMLDKKNLEKAEEEVRLEKEAAKAFITPDTLEAAIEYAVNNPVDYNYAIDMEGNKIIGKDLNSSKL